MAKKVFTDESLKTFVDEIKAYTDIKANASHKHKVEDISDLTATATELNYVDGVTSAIQTQLDNKAALSHEHNVEDISDLTATADELNYVSGVTSNIQTQLNGKAASKHEHKVEDITDLTATATELNYMSSVTSNVQEQLDGKQATISGGASTVTDSNLTASRALISNDSGKIAVSAITTTELDYMSGVTSNVQSQLDNKAALSHASQHAVGGTDPITPEDIGAGRVNPNLFDNWYFVNPVNQRGQTEYTGKAQFVIDRWYSNRSTATITVGSEGLTITDTTGGYLSLSQRIANHEQYSGKTVTLSILVKNITGNFRSIIKNTDNTSERINLDFNTSGLHSITGILHEATEPLRVYINPMTSNASATIVAIKLELGTQQTLAHQDADGNWVLNEIPDYNEQLLRCCMNTADSADSYANNTITTGNKTITTPSSLKVLSANPHVSVIDADSEAQGALWQTNNQTVLSNRNVAGSTANHRSIVINNSSSDESIDNALYLYTADDSDTNWYKILHTGNTGVAAPTSLREGYLRYFTSLTPLGITKGEETIASMIAAMPNYSMLMLQINTESDGYNPATYPSVWGLLTIKKYNNYRVEIDYMDIKSNPKTFYKKSWNNGTESDWFELLHTGNTGSLADFNKYVWKRRKVNCSITLGDSTTVSMSTCYQSTPKAHSFSYSTSYTADRDKNTLSLSNATSASVTYDTSGATTSATLNALKGKYWKYDGNFYYTPSDAADSVVATISQPYGQYTVVYQTISITAQPVTFSGITYGDWEIVTSTSATAYPETFTYSGGYEYIKYGGMDRRQTSTAIKHMTFYGTGAAEENTIYVDEIPTLFIIYEGSTPILFKWGHQGIVLLSDTSSGITTISATYNTANKSITFNKVFAKDIYPMNAAKRYHCYLIYG